MGGCVSVLPSGPPWCRICNKEGGKPWSQLSTEERDKWVWKDGKAACRSCIVNERLERLKFERERRVYKKAKEEMYPPPCEGLKPLHSIKSGQQWDNSHSFYDNWKPPSSLKRLLSAIRHAQEEEPGKHVGMQRKPTGYVPPAALPAEMQEGGELAGDAAAACAAAGSPPSQRQQQQQLEQEGYAQLATLDEEAYVEVVEEFSLTRGSAASRWQSGDGAEQSSEAVREPPQPSSQPPSPPRKLQQQGSQGSAFSQHDDSAYESQAREVGVAASAPWASSTA